jgi:hypothetical protein
VHAPLRPAVPAITDLNRKRCMTRAAFCLSALFWNTIKTDYCNLTGLSSHTLKS